MKLVDLRIGEIRAKDFYDAMGDFSICRDAFMLSYSFLRRKSGLRHPGTRRAGCPLGCPQFLDI